MTETNAIQIIEQQYIEAFRQLAENTRLKKQLDEQEKAIKAELQTAMEKYDVRMIDNEFVKVTLVAGSTATSLDTKALETKEPDLFEELLRDYPKVTTKKPYLTFKVK